MSEAYPYAPLCPSILVESLANACLMATQCGLKVVAKFAENYLIFQASLRNLFSRQKHMQQKTSIKIYVPQRS